MPFEMADGGEEEDDDHKIVKTRLKHLISNKQHLAQVYFRIFLEGGRNNKGDL